MPKQNSGRYAGRPTCYGQDGGINQKFSPQPSAEGLRRNQVCYAAKKLFGVDLTPKDLVPDQPAQRCILVARMPDCAQRSHLTRRVAVETVTSAGSTRRALEKARMADCQK
jgi:hypothetical protein